MRLQRQALTNDPPIAFGGQVGDDDGDVGPSGSHWAFTSSGGYCACMTLRDRWSKRPELFAKFDFPVEPISHFDCVRRGQDAAMTQCARPEFESAIHPADDTTAHEIIGNLID